MTKVTFYYRVGGHTVLVKAKAKNVSESGVKGLTVEVRNEDGQTYEHVMDRDTFSDLENQAIEELQMTL